DVATLSGDMETVGQLVRDVATLSGDMETVGQLVRDVATLGTYVESAKTRVESLEGGESALKEEIEETATRLAALQRGLVIATPLSSESVKAQKSEEPILLSPLDELAAESVYSALEEQMRGPTSEIRARQASYIDLVQALPKGGEVVDLGCGRGEFLSLLDEADIPAVGVDLSGTFVVECKEQGHKVEKRDLLDFLTSSADESLRAVVSFQVLEHLPFPTLLRVFAEAYRVLKPGGLFLGETPNGANLAVGGSTFWLDHTHVRPLHPELLKHLAKFYGYCDVRVDLVSLPKVPWKLTSKDAGDSVNDAVLGLQGYVLSGQDALLVAYRP
ncbi:MAG: class I SAM-dependent methyltransferase, partial [Bacteroidetes Order II. Incertae sedis bacterium]|nr:class I SAM-dependent methyltransferase [Bacteroidetes Order II. bacterium]